ncbi:MAG TPA: M24 family metallopeptidase [Steroidobacteraceae bacterium]|jgi:Xaa-Pro aminopeptidase
MNENARLTAQSLKVAQDRAQALFDAVVSEGLIQPGKSESELSRDIHELARRSFGVKRHWHRKVVRAGANTLLTYHEDGEEARIGEDDVVYLDFGPVFGEWEADFGRTYVLGEDPLKIKLVADLGTAFAAGRRHFEAETNLSAGELYDFVEAKARELGWEFGAPTAGHLIGHFPHERVPDKAKRFSIRHGNAQSLREADDQGAPRHWILEIHLVDRTRRFGGFLEELLTA